jgi:acetyl esterase
MTNATLTGLALFAPLAADCEALRLTMISSVPSQSTAATPAQVQQEHRDQTPLRREQWVPHPDSMPVSARDEVIAGVPVRRYLPADGSEPSGTLMWLHGGGWVFGDIDSADPLARTACVETGWEIISVEYRLAPQHPFPAGVDDGLAVASALLAEGRRLVIGGDSAGGNLAAVAARTFAGHPSLVGQVLVYPCTDPSLQTPSSLEFTEGPFITRAGMQWCYTHYLQGAAADDPRVDLTDDVPTGLAPALVFTVGHDPLRDEGIAYARALSAAGVPTRHLHAPDQFHGAIGRSGVLPSAAVHASEIWRSTVELFGEFAAPINGSVA